MLSQWTRTQPRAWLLDEAARRRIPMAHPREIEDVLKWPHLRERNAWETVDDAGRTYTAPRVPLLGPLPPARSVDAQSLLRRWRDGPDLKA